MREFTPFVLGLVGGRAAGKTTCARHLARLGLPLFDLVEQTEALARLTAVSDEVVAARLDTVFTAFVTGNRHAAMIVLDGPDLLADGWAERCHALLAVLTPRDERLERAAARAIAPDPSFDAVTDGMLLDRCSFFLDAAGPAEDTLRRLDEVLYRVAEAADQRFHLMRRGR